MRKEVSFPMRAGMAVLALGCVALGLGATWFVRVFDPITQQALGVRASSALVTARGWRYRRERPTAAPYPQSGLRCSFCLPARHSRFRWPCVGGVAASKGRRGIAACPGLTDDNEYTATAFSKPLRMIFSALYRPRREIQAEYEVSPYYPSAIRFESEIEPTFEKHLYDPLRQWIMAVANRMKGIQAGSINLYLAYIFITLILLLLFGVRA
jgi:hydrogenase-4 component B